jgi:Rod binding domain-containing protein
MVAGIGSNSIIDAMPSLSRMGNSDIESLRVGKKNESEEAKEARLWKVASSFESLMFRQILKTARQTQLGEDLLASSSGSRMMREMQDDELAKCLAESDKDGLAFDIYTDLKRLDSADAESINRMALERANDETKEGLPLHRSPDYISVSPDGESAPLNFDSAASNGINFIKPEALPLYQSLQMGTSNREEH